MAGSLALWALHPNVCRESRETWGRFSLVDGAAHLQHFWRPRQDPSLGEEITALDKKQVWAERFAGCNRAASQRHFSFRLVPVASTA